MACDFLFDFVHQPPRFQDPWLDSEIVAHVAHLENGEMDKGANLWPKRTVPSLTFFE